jgi:2-aminomuconate deaminase
MAQPQANADQQGGSPPHVQPLGKYPAVRRAGDFLFVSGTSARLPDGSIAGVQVDADGTKRQDVAAQTRCVLEQIEHKLRTVGASLRDCVDITVYLTDMADFDSYNEAYAAFFGDDAPARTTLAVRALPAPDMVVEMKAVAYAPAETLQE